MNRAKQEEEEKEKIRARVHLELKKCEDEVKRLQKELQVIEKSFKDKEGKQTCGCAATQTISSTWRHWHSTTAFLKFLETCALHTVQLRDGVVA